MEMLWKEEQTGRTLSPVPVCRPEAGRVWNLPVLPFLVEHGGKHGNVTGQGASCTHTHSSPVSSSPTRIASSSTARRQDPSFCQATSAVSREEDGKQPTTRRGQATTDTEEEAPSSSPPTQASPSLPRTAIELDVRRQRRLHVTIAAPSPRATGEQRHMRQARGKRNAARRVLGVERDGELLRPGCWTCLICLVLTVSLVYV